MPGCTTFSGRCRSPASCLAPGADPLDATFLRNPLETRLADATVPAALLGAWLLGLTQELTCVGWRGRRLSNGDGPSFNHQLGQEPPTQVSWRRGWSMKSHPAVSLLARTAAAVILVCTAVAIWRVGDVTGKLDE